MTTSAPSEHPARRSLNPDRSPPGPDRPGPVMGASVELLLFASAREAAGTAKAPMRAGTVAELLQLARGRFGDRFAAVLERSRVWVNGEPVDGSHPLSDGDEVAVLPPVSGG